MRVNHAGRGGGAGPLPGPGTRRPRSARTRRLRACGGRGNRTIWPGARSGCRELHGRTSLLNPLWYAGSFAIGAMAGAFGDRTSLGFIAETERQVESHLRDHLERLPRSRRRSRADPRADDAGRDAAWRDGARLGGDELPLPLRAAMRSPRRDHDAQFVWAASEIPLVLAIPGLM